ncbi:DNA polymerase I [Butyrivibrio sp. MC2021]|uniref:DNA polymerase I n=1 Tax=Butyrivibrio sp. MC2021 TaxID=1408306 RepID=UPI00047A3340|nr:DNA polymerase I [Butyrivibrio sp. MC2021]
MAERKLVTDGTKLIRDAYYALPVFCDSEGNAINGLYGALFKLSGMIGSGEYDTVYISFCENEKEEVTDIKRQAEGLLAALKKVDESLAGTDAEAEGAPVSDELKERLTAVLSDISPMGNVKSGISFNLKIEITSDLNEVEKIFSKALEYGRGGSENFTGYFPITEYKQTGSKDKELLGLALCFDKESAYFIPVQGFITENYLGTKLAELSKEAPLATFDIKESYRFFEPCEISSRTAGYTSDESITDGARCFDTLIGAYVNNPIKNDYRIEDISAEYLKLTLKKKEDYFGKEPLRDADEKALSEYACKAAYTCFLAAPLIRKKLVKTGMDRLFYEIEMPLSYILFAMEKEGIIARRDELKAYGDKLQVRITELEKKIYESAGCEFNINSPKQLGEILFERLGLPAEKKTKSGYSTAADVLDKLAPDYPIVADVLEYRGLAKLKSTYADGLAAFIEEDGRIHTSFNQTITATGRISSTEPNLQNIPMRTELGRLIRKVFVPKDGYVFADADYSQIELRILAHMSEDHGLISAYHEGEDIHSITASKVFHVPLNEVTPLQRRNAKAVNFGIVYGISSFGLSQDLSISRSEAKEYMDKYFETYPGVKAYQEKVIQDAKNTGYSITLYGRRRPIPELKMSNFNMRQFGERVAMNAPIQGTAADIMKIAMINVFFRLRKEQLKSRLILQIHDELVIETSPDEKDVVTALLQQEMENAARLSVPLEVECHTGTDWYEAK